MIAKFIMFYAVLGGMLGTVAIYADGIDLFPDCRGSEYARPTCGDNASASAGKGYRSGD
jgi:hypothetical protein